MSALRSDFQATFLYEVSKLEEPWRSILPELEDLTPEQVIQKIGTTSIKVSGVYVHNYQCTFEKLREIKQHTCGKYALCSLWDCSFLHNWSGPPVFEYVHVRKSGFHGC